MYYKIVDRVSIKSYSVETNSFRLYIYIYIYIYIYTRVFQKSSITQAEKIMLENSNKTEKKKDFWFDFCIDEVYK